MVPTIDVNGLTMYYEFHGEPGAPPLVFICGLALDVSEIQPLLGELAQGYRVLAFDNRGAGRTDKPDEPYTIPMMAADTAALMRAVAMPRAAVLGLSMGGRIALSLALDTPEVVSRLILVSTGARVWHGWRRRLMSQVASIPMWWRAHPQPRYAFLRQLRASSAYDPTDRLREITVPVSILHGEDDRTMPLQIAREMHEAIPGSTLRIFPGGHLFLLFRQRHQFVEAVLADATATTD